MSVKTSVTFRPIHTPLNVESNEMGGGQLGRIFHQRYRYTSKGVLTKADIPFVEGLVAANVLDSHNLLRLLQSADSVEVSVYVRDID